MQIENMSRSVLMWKSVFNILNKSIETDYIVFIFSIMLSKWKVIQNPKHAGTGICYLLLTDN